MSWLHRLLGMRPFPVSVPKTDLERVQEYHFFCRAVDEDGKIIKGIEWLVLTREEMLKWTQVVGK